MNEKVQPDPQNSTPIMPARSRGVGFWLSIVLPILLGLLLAFYTWHSFTEAQIEEISRNFRNADYTWIGLGALIAILGNVSRAWRWKYSLDHLGFRSSFSNNFMAVNIGNLLNLTVPKSGEISRAVIVNKYDGMPFDQSFGSIIAERVVDVLVLFAFILIAVALQYDIARAFILDKMPREKLFVAGALALLAGIALLLLWNYSKNSIVLALKHRLEGLKDGLFSIVHMEAKTAYALHTIFIWLSYLLMFYVTIFAFPETASLSYGAVVTVFVVGTVAVAFTNNGFGSYPFLVAQILYFYSIPKTVGNAFGWIVWTSQTIVVIALGLLSFLLLPILNRKQT